MANATTAGTQFAYITEVTQGVTPGTGNGRLLRTTGEKLNFSLSKAVSEELRSDRVRSGATTIYAEAGGSLDVHMIYGEYDPLLSSLFQSPFTVYGTNGVAGAASSVTATATTLTAAVATAGNDSWANLARGQWFRLSAAGSANDGKLFRVSTSAAPTTTVITLDASTPAAVMTAIASSVQTSRLTHGNTNSYFSIEHQQTDISQYFLYKGMEVNSFDLSIDSKSLINGSFDFIGLNVVRAAATGLPGTNTASRTYDVMNASTGVGQIWVGTTPLTTTKLRSIKLKATSNLRPQDGIGTLGPIGIGTGDFDFTGSFSAYLSDGTLYDAWRNDTYLQLIISFQDAAGNGYVVTLPRVLLTKCDITAGKINENCMADFDFQAFSDDANAVVSLRKAAFLDRVGAALA
jgi:hypothetical protein